MSEQTEENIAGYLREMAEYRAMDMVSLLLKQIRLRDEFGHEYVLTGFAEDGCVAILSRQGGPPSMPMEVSTLDGLEVVK